MTLLICFLQPVERPVVVPKARIDQRYEIGRDVALLRSYFQLVQHPQCLTPPPGDRIGIPERGLHSRVACGKGSSLSYLRDRLLMHPFLHISLADPEIAPKEVRIELERPAVVFYRLVILPGPVERIADIRGSES